MSLTLPDPNKVPGDSNHTSDTNLIIEAINTLKSQVDNIPAGPTGAQGEPGTPGAAGTPATVTVGSTTTSAAGGNELSQNMDKNFFYRFLVDDLKTKDKMASKEFHWLEEKIGQGALPHHSFHVLNVWMQGGHGDGLEALTIS